jgi:Flp pilus assembly protein CpaB
VLGRLVAGPVRRGEPLTDVRLLGPSLLAAVARGPDVVAVPVRFADAGAAALLRPGDRVDVLAAPPDTALPPDLPAAAPAPDLAAAAPADPPAGGPAPPGRSPPGADARPPADAGAARVVAANVVVLLVAGGGDPATGGATTLGEGALVVVACSPGVARALAAAAANDRLSPVLRAPP